MSDSLVKQQSLDPLRERTFQIMLSTGQAQYLKRVLPKRYSCQPDSQKLAKTRSKGSNYSKQLTELFNITIVQPSSICINLDSSSNERKDEDGEGYASVQPFSNNNQSSSMEKSSLVSRLEHKKEEVLSCRNYISSFITQLFQKKNLLKYYAPDFQTLRETFNAHPDYSLQDLHTDIISILKNQEIANSRSHKLAKTSLSKVYGFWRQNLDKNVTGATSIGVQAGRRFFGVNIDQQEVLRIDGESDDGFTATVPSERQNHKRAPPDFRDNFAQRNQVAKRFCNSGREGKAVPNLIKSKSQVPKQPIKPPETVTEQNLKKKTLKVSSFSFASNVLKKYSDLSPSEQQELSQIAKQCQLSTIDIRTIKNSPRVNIQPFLQAIDDKLKKKGVAMSSFDDRSVSEEYIESSFEIEDED